MVTTNYSHNHADGFTSEGSVVQDKLFDRETITRKGVVLSGEGVLLRGTLLGKVKLGAATSAVKAGGANTGTATMSAVTLGAKAKVGVYAVRMLTATTFRVEDPDGFVLGDGATGAAFADDIGFTMTAGGTAMVAGDGFDVTVAAGSGKYRKSLAAATDGSDVPDAILLNDVDATSADAEGIIAIKGRFGTAGVIFGTGHTAASVDDALRGKNIYLETVIG